MSSYFLHNWTKHHTWHQYTSIHTHSYRVCLRLISLKNSLRSFIGLVDYYNEEEIKNFDGENLAVEEPQIKGEGNAE